MRQNTFRRFGTMLDCSRGAVMTVETVKKWIDIISDLGYNTLMLYTEDTYEVEGQPYFGYLRGRYSVEELKSIDDYAFEHGVELIPCIQTLAHLEAIFRWSTYSDIRDCNDILLVDNAKTYELIEAMFQASKKAFRSHTLHIGMDEAFMLGRGKYQDIHGYKDRFDILLKHLKKVSEIAKKYDYELIMWGDMFFRLLGVDYDAANNKMPPAEITALIPDNVNLVYWDYYSKDYSNYDKQIKKHSAIKDNIWFAGGLWSWLGYAPHNKFSMSATKAAFDACANNGVRDVFLTMWGDDGAECSRFALLPSLYYAAEIAKGNCDFEIIKKGFYQKFGIAFDDFMLLDLPDTPNQDKDFSNPDTYMLFNDCFLGVYDSTVKDGVGSSYSVCANKLNKVCENEEYGYIFKTLKILCEILSIKYELGVKTRNAYRTEEKDTLRILLTNYDDVLALLDDFYEAFCLQWHKENKPFGFEIHDIRIGGLRQRIEHCRSRISQFLDGIIESLPELDETLLDPCGKGTEYIKESGNFKSWARSAMIDEL